MRQPAGLCRLNTRLQVGLVSKLDVFRAELQASQAQEAMLRAETSLQTALESFRSTLGLAATEPVEPEAVDLPDIAATEPLEPIEVLVARGQQVRIDLAESRDQVEDARRTASLARQNLLPQLDLNFSMSQLGLGTSFGTAWKAADRRFSVFLSSSYPLERSAQSANRAEAELTLAGRQRSLRQQQLQIELEVRSAARELERIRVGVRSWSTLAWVPLMAGAGSEIIVARWRELLNLIVPAGRRSSVNSVALLTSGH